MSCCLHKKTYSHGNKYFCDYKKFLHGFRPALTHGSKSLQLPYAEVNFDSIAGLL